MHLPLDNDASRLYVSICEMDTTMEDTMSSQNVPEAIVAFPHSLTCNCGCRARAGQVATLRRDGDTADLLALGYAYYDVPAAEHREARTLAYEVGDLSGAAVSSRYSVEATDPYSAHPDLTDERHDCATVEEAGLRFAELSGWDETDAINALQEGDLTHTDEETGREVTAVRVPVNAGVVL